MLDTHGREYFAKLFLSLAKLLAKLGCKPLHVTFMALFLGLIGAFCFFYGWHISSLVLLWLSGFLDVLDGELARYMGVKSQKGALLDIFFDRLVEIAYIFAFINTASTLSLLLLSASIILSLTLFLSVGAMSVKKSHKAFYYQAGLMERTEGFLLFSLIILFPSYATFLVYLFASLIAVTILQRLKEALELLE